jgi:hypothetical protein
MWPGITATRDFYIDAAHFLMGPGRSVAQMKPMTISEEMKLQKPIEPLDVVNQHWGSSSLFLETELLRCTLFWDFLT